MSAARPSLIHCGLGSRLIFLAVVACWPAALWAAEYRADQTVHIKADEVIDGNLYAFGEKVTVEGTIKGDLIAAGSQIVIKGAVEGDLAAAGQTVLVESRLGGDARVAGQVLKFASTAEVPGELMAAGLSLELEQGSNVGGDVLYAGYQADLSGDITGNVHGGMARARLAGTVEGNVDIEVGGGDDDPPPQTFGPPPPLAMPDVPGGLTIASTANLEGDLHYSSHREANVEQGATLANPAKFSQLQAAAAPPAPTTTQVVLGKVRHYACVAILGLALVLLLPGWSTRLADNVRTRPLGSFLGGIVALAGFVVLLLLLIVAVIAIAVLAGMATLGELAAVVVVVGLLSLVGLVGGFWLFMTYLGQAIASLAIGRLATGSLGARQILIAFLVGLIIFALASSIPYAGSYIAFLGILLALGGLALWMITGKPAPSVAEAKAVRAA
jgi:cytoskeletal protein CcmA (bactofilin family)